MSTQIQWTDETWNPTVGCDRTSPGCAHCYAKALHDKRHKAVLAGKQLAAQYAKPFETLQMMDGRLDAPLHWKKPRRVFVNSVSDLFHEAVPDAFIARVFEMMSFARRHTFQILTKRAARMAALLPTLADQHTAADGSGWPLPNVWLGVSVENQHFADERIPLLLATPAAVRFISAEPLLGELEIERFLQYEPFHEHYKMTFDHTEWRGVDWVIVGGESGHGARPVCLSWIRNIVHDCAEAHVPCFVKQLGARPYETTDDDGADGECRWPIGKELKLKDRKGGDPAEWSPYLRVRQFPEVR